MDQRRKQLIDDNGFMGNIIFESEEHTPKTDNSNFVKASKLLLEARQLRRNAQSERDHATFTSLEFHARIMLAEEFEAKARVLELQACKLYPK